MIHIVAWSGESRHLAEAVAPQRVESRRLAVDLRLQLHNVICVGVGRRVEHGKQIFCCQMR